MHTLSNIKNLIFVVVVAVNIQEKPRPKCKKEIILEAADTAVRHVVNYLHIKAI